MDFVRVFLDKTAPEPLYAQLYGRLAQQIRSGEIPAGERLPGKRAAAGQLGVSVNTVDEAYQMLAAEGYVEARPRSGFWVARLEQQLVPPPQRRAAALPQHETPPPYRYSFATGGIDTSLFPRKMYNRILREVLADENGLYARGEATGDEVLRQALADYLRGYRGVRCSAGQIVVGAGLEVLVSMLARLLGQGPVAVENPGYAKTAQILGNVGVAVCPVPVDKSGMQPAPLYASNAAAAYLTPSHQFPTGGVMPVGRRTDLLRWAARRDGFIIEDDYDSEFRFDGRPLPSLQGLDEEHSRVVYAGTFSRSLAPGLRAAYMVLPPPLLARWHAAYGTYACTVSRPEQHTLARFMSEGHFSRSLNRMRASYRHRRGLLLAALDAHLPAGSYQTENTHTGLYFLLRVPGLHAAAFASTARENGILVRALSEYLQPGAASPLPAQDDALVLGYGGLADGEVDPAMAQLAGLLRQSRVG